jgi:hypothetical protein
MDQAAGDEVNDGVTPAGTPERLRLILPLNPFSGLALMVLMPVFPGVTVRLAGEAESV